MKKKLLLILFTFALSLGIFGASFSLESYAEERLILSLHHPSDNPEYIYDVNIYSDNSNACLFPSTFSYSGTSTEVWYSYYPSISTPYLKYSYVYTEGYTYKNSTGYLNNSNGFGLIQFLGSDITYSYYPVVNRSDAQSLAIKFNSDGIFPTLAEYDENIIIKNYNAYWLGGINSIVPVLHGAVSDNVDHIDIELYWDDLDSTAIATYSVNPILGRFFSFGSAVPYIGMQAHKMIYKIVPYSVTGNYGATYYSTVSSFNLNNTRYLDVPKANGTGTGRLDFNSYTQSVNSYSPTNNINQSTVIDTYYNRTYNNDYSTSEEFYNEYDYSTVDKSYFSNNDLTFNTNIEINFPQLDGDWLKNLFQTFSFNLPTDLMNHWIPGVPNWVIDIILAGIAIIVAAVIAKLLFTIL